MACFLKIFSIQYEFLINGNYTLLHFLRTHSDFFNSVSFTTYNFFKTVRFLKMSSVIELNEQLERSLGKN